MAGPTTTRLHPSSKDQFHSESFYMSIHVIWVIRILYSLHCVCVQNKTKKKKGNSIRRFAEGKKKERKGGIHAGFLPYGLLFAVPA